MRMVGLWCSTTSTKPTSTKPTTPLPAMRPGLATDALWRELAPLLGLDRRPLAAPAGAFERGWQLASQRAVLQYQQSQLEYSTRQQAQRLLQLHGGEGGGGEVSPPAAHASGSPAPLAVLASVSSPAAHASGSPAPLAHEGGASERDALPRVWLTRPKSTQLVVEQLQERKAAIEALREEISAFTQELSRADENPAKAQKRRGADAEPRSRAQMNRADEDPAKAQKRRGADAKPRSRAQMARCSGERKG